MSNEPIFDALNSERDYTGLMASAKRYTKSQSVSDAGMVPSPALAESIELMKKHFNGPIEFIEKDEFLLEPFAPVKPAEVGSPWTRPGVFKIDPETIDPEAVSVKPWLTPGDLGGAFDFETGAESVRQAVEAYKKSVSDLIEENPGAVITGVSEGKVEADGSYTYMIEGVAPIDPEAAQRYVPIPHKKAATEPGELLAGGVVFLDTEYVNEGSQPSYKPLFEGADEE